MHIWFVLICDFVLELKKLPENGKVAPENGKVARNRKSCRKLPSILWTALHQVSGVMRHTT